MNHPDLSVTLDPHQDGDVYVICTIDPEDGSCAHRVRSCGSIARSDRTEWPHLDWAAVRWLHAEERLRVLDRGEPRRLWFCQNCLTSESHPLYRRQASLL